jgi:hypothetical protein
VPHPDAGFRLLHTWYPSFVHIDAPSQEFFSNFSVAPEERLFGIVDGDHTVEGAQRDIDSLVKLAPG